jgi:hypothetical protein
VALAQYIIRDIPDDNWTRFIERADRDKWPLRALILQLVDDYGNERIGPSQGSPEQKAEYAWLRPHYRSLARQAGFTQRAAEDQWNQLVEAVRARQTRKHAQLLEGVPDTTRREILTWLADASRDIAPLDQLSLRAVAHIRTGPSRTEQRPFQYEVIGLPPGQQAWIAAIGHDKTWMILRVVSDVPGEWQGQYATANEALRAIADSGESEGV